MNRAAKWIWAACEPSENVYVIARKRLHVTEKATGELRVSADSDFAAFLNGVFLGRGQYSDFPEAKTFTRLPLDLVAGENLLEIRAYYCGSDFLTHLKGTPRLWAEVWQGNELLAGTGADWEVAPDASFRAGPIEKLNPMLGYTWECDARRTPAQFRPAQVLTAADVPVERPVPMIAPGEPLATVPAWHGYFRRREPSASPGVAMSTDMVAPAATVFSGVFAELSPDTDGWVLIVDLKRESTGLLHFVVDAPAGAVLDIAHGEHLELGRVLCCSNDRTRCYADRYICKEGRNDFTFYFRRIGARYLEMHISHAARPVTVHRFTLLPTEMILPAAAFHAEDRLLEASHAIGVRTLQLCMHEHYEDCPWREQALYGYDARNQLLFGYYAFGNYDFASSSLVLLGKSMFPNGFLNLTAPGDLKLFIPIFTFAWLAALWEHELYSGSRAPYLCHRERILQAARGWLAQPTPEGLFLPPPDFQDRKVWNFCEWCSGLDGRDNPEEAANPTAFYNLYLVEALRAIGKLERDEEWWGKAEALGQRVERFFWCEEEGCYATRRGDSRRHGHVQHLMLALQLVPPCRRERVMANACSAHMIPATFGSYIYLIRAMAACNRVPELEYMLRRDFDAMTLSGATSFWEVAGGAKGFGSYGGSLCHGWSCAGIFFDGAYRLGVVPLEAGFRRFALEIHPCGLSSLFGEVPTPHGAIQIQWHVEGNGRIAVRLRHPEEIRLDRVAANIRLV